MVSQTHRQPLATRLSPRRTSICASAGLWPPQLFCALSMLTPAAQTGWVPNWFKPQLKAAAVGGGVAEEGGGVQGWLFAGSYWEHRQSGDWGELATNPNLNLW